LGILAVGKTASMALLRANRVDDVRNAQQIEGVFLRGNYFSHQDVNGLLAEARELMRQATPRGYDRPSALPEARHATAAAKAG
jgi:hypothetical protein